MIAKRNDVFTSYLEPTGDVGNELIWVSVVRSVSRTPRLALSLAPSKMCLGGDLPAAADVNAVFPTSGDLEAAA